jgi:replicative DNA helicase
MSTTDSLLPYSPEAERTVLGCCLLDPAKIQVALKAGVSSRWFYDARHIEIFNVLEAMARNGGGDFVIAALKLRELGKFEQIGGVPYLGELQDTLPSAENIDYYLAHLRAYFQRRSVIEIGTRLRVLAQDTRADPDRLYSDAGDVLRQ